MPQLHFYVPDEVDTLIRTCAKRSQIPVSQYLAAVVKREVAGVNQWPQGYFDLFTQWDGLPAARPEPLPLETRQSFK